MFWWRLWQLRSKDPYRRQAGARGLVKYGKRAVGPLIRVLSDWTNCDFVRMASAVSLGKIRDRRALEPLIKALSNDRIGEYASEALGTIGDRRAIAPLVLSWSERGGIHGWLDIRHVRLRHPYESDALEKIDPDWKSSPEVKAIMPTLLERLKSSDSVGLFLGHLRDPGTVEPILELLEGLHGELEESGRRGAITALLMMGDRRALPVYIGALSEQWCRAAALEVLQSMPDESATEALASLLRRPDDPDFWGIGHGGAEDRFQIARTLMIIGSEKAKQYVVQALDDPSWDVRFGAARALAEHGDRRAKDVLLSTLTMRYSPGCSDGWDVGWARRIGSMLNPLGHQALEDLCTLSDSRKSPVGVDAIAGFGGPMALRALCARRSRSDSVECARNSLEDAIIHIADNTVIDVLIEILGKWDSKKIVNITRDPCLHKLAEIGDERAIAPVAKVVESCRMRCAHAVDVLLQLLEKFASRATPEALHIVAHLEDPVQLEYYTSSDDPGLIWQSGNHRVDCSLVRRLAKRELKRRGLKI